MTPIQVDEAEEAEETEEDSSDVSSTTSSSTSSMDNEILPGLQFLYESLDEDDTFNIF